MIEVSGEIHVATRKFSVLDHVPIGVCILKRDYTVLFWNSSLEEWSGIARGRILGSDVCDLFPHLRSPRYTSRLQSIFEGGPPTIFSSQLHTAIFPSKTGDGKVRIQHTVVTPVQISEGGEWHALFAVQDVSDLSRRIQAYRVMRDQAVEEVRERERVEQKLLRAQAELEIKVRERTADLTLVNEQLQNEIEVRLRIEEELKKLISTLDTVVEHIPQGVVLIDPDYRIVLSNSIGRDYLLRLGAPVRGGEILTEVAGVKVEDLFSSASRLVRREVTLIGTAKSVFELEGSTISQGGIIRGMVLVLKDVTEEVSLQERIQTQDRLAAVGQLAAGIAHDFNNILTGIIGFAEIILSESLLAEEDRQMIGAILDNGLRAAHLVRQILDFSRKSMSEMKSIDLSAFLREFSKFIRRTIPESIKISVHSEPAEHRILGDPAKIQQILANLALNARDAMAEGGELRFGLSRRSLCHGERPPVPDMPEGEWIVLEVSDTGTGIASEILAHVFEPFFTTKETGKGTGLGLSQVYGIVKQHGGFIDVRTRVGSGTDFIIYFSADLEEKSVSPAAEDLPAPRGKAETILIVEDNPSVRDLLQRKLSKLNFTILTAANGSDALRKFQEHGGEIKLIITDLVMPEMGGIELSRLITSSHPATKVIALSGYPLGSEKVDFQSSGIIECIQKPFEMQTLVRIVCRILNDETAD